MATTKAKVKKPFSFLRRIMEIDLFFEKRGKAHQTMRRLAKRLQKAGIPYAIAGGMAVNAHQHERTTKDVDFLVTNAGLATFRERCVGKWYDPVPGRQHRFRDRVTDITIDFLVTGNFPGSGKPGPIAFPDPTDVSEEIDGQPVINLPTLIQLKLAARRYHDFGDVVFLIRVHDLDEAFLAKLHPSVHGDFIECLEEKRREDSYES